MSAPESSLALIGDARAALEQARTLSDVKAIRDLAKGAERYAKAKKLGLAAERYAQEIILRAERKLGEMLAETPKAKGSAGAGRPPKGGRSVRPPKDDAPSLKDVGLTKSESSRAQKIAAIDETTFEEFVAKATAVVKDDEEAVPKGRALTKARLERVEREKQADKRRAEPTEHATQTGEVEIRHGDLRETLGDLDAQVDAIITDPPYPAEFLDEFDALAELASRILKPDGVLVAMVGQAHLPDYIARLSAHLTYRWTGAYLTEGPATRVHHRNIGTKWKPILIYDLEGKRPFLTQDVFRSGGDDKQHHGWGQSESGMADLVERFTKPGQLVVDPFLGGGTTAIVCRDLGRRFVGCDVDAAAVKTTRERLA
jgi:SAM-dependent methyltransferase